MKGVVKDGLRANDHVIVCVIDSSDLWLKFKLHMAWGTGKTLESEVELKIDKLMTGMTFQQLAQKLSLQIWNQHLGDKRNTQKEKYVLTEFKVFKIAKEYLEE